MKRKILIIVLVLFLSAFLSFLMSTQPVQSSTTFTSPIYKVYFPIIPRYETPRTKCVAITDIGTINQINQVGASCTYIYWNYTYYGSVEVSNMFRPSQAYTLTNNSNYFMGWNEPEANGVSPESGAKQWLDIIKANPNKLAVSPAPNAYPLWLEQFYTSYIQQYNQLPKLNVLAIHCYWSADECKQVIGKVIQLANKWNIPEVWVTEWGYQSADWKIQAISLLNWMKSQPKITRYYWYPFSDINNTYGYKNQQLFNGNSLTEKGIWYRNQN